MEGGGQQIRNFEDIINGTPFSIALYNWHADRSVQAHVAANLNLTARNENKTFRLESVVENMRVESFPPWFEMRVADDGCQLNSCSSV